MGLIGYGLGTITGLALAAILVFVINPAYFGWTIDWAWPVFVFREALVLTLLAVLAAGWLPAQRAASLPPSIAMRDE